AFAVATKSCGSARKESFVTKRRITILVLVAAIAIIAGGLGYRYYLSTQRALPAGIVQGTGRIEADEIQIAKTYPGRIAEIDFEERDLVKAGQVLAKMDTRETE